MLYWQIDNESGFTNMSDENNKTNENEIKKRVYQAPTIECLNSTKIETASALTNIPESIGGLLSGS